MKAKSPHCSNEIDTWELMNELMNEGVVKLVVEEMWKQADSDEGDSRYGL